MEGGKGRVCVTGGTGYVASWLIKKLLENGYFVNATIRCRLGHEKDVSYLTNLPGASKMLSIFNANLDEPESFKESIKGCIGVFHLAHAIDLESNESEEVHNQRAVNAMLEILQASLDSKTVKKVVYTSTDATILTFNGMDLDVADESSWSDVDHIRESMTFEAAYCISKLLTEKAGFEFAEKHGLEFVSINPAFIHGPFITPSCPTSVRILLAMVVGDDVNYTGTYTFVHVDDAARAHIFLFENPNVKGRYLCMSHHISTNNLAEFLSVRYPQFKIDRIDLQDDTEAHKLPLPSSRKLLATGFKFKYSLEDMYDEAIQCCQEIGVL